MAGTHAEQIKYLKSKIRLFEDKKISGHDLSKEIQYVAREIFDPEEAGLRRALENYGNRIAVTAGRERGYEAHAHILDLVDQIQGDLIDQGY